MHHDPAPERRTGHRGAAMIEYVLLLALFTLVAVPGIAKLREGTGNQARDTSSKLGGAPVATTPPPTTRPPATTTTLPPSSMTVDAGPDARISPGTVHVQNGTVTSPANPVQSLGWNVTGTGASSATTTPGPTTGTPELQNTTLSFSSKRPGRYYLNLSAKNLSEAKSDFAEVVVTSGQVDTTTSGGGWYTDATNTRWNTWGSVTLTNQYSERVDGLTVTYRFTTSDGRTQTGTCVTSGGGCTVSMYSLDTTVTWVDFEVTSISGDTLDGHNALPPAVRVWTSTLVPVTTTASTTTVAPPPTTTARPTTTVPATTTTRRGGPNG